MDAHKGRLAFQLGFQKFDPKYLTGDFLLKSRLRQAEDPRDKLYALYHVIQVCHYNLPKINYAETVEKVYEDVTFSLLSQSQSWWILTHLLHSHTSTATTLEIPSWVPDFNSKIQWHQHIEFFAQSPDNPASLAIQWSHNRFCIERLQDGGISTSGIFLWSVKAVTSTLAPTPALDKTFEENFEESRYDILVKKCEDFLFTIANWFDLMMNTAQADTEAPPVQHEETAAQALNAITRAFLRSMTARNLNFGIPVDSSDTEHEFHNVVSAIQPCMAPSPIHPCVACGISGPHDSDDAIQHSIQRTSNQAQWLNFIIHILYVSAVNRSMFRTNDLDSCPGHFAFCGGQARPGDQIVLLPGASDPVVVRKRPGPNGADCYRIVGIANGMVGQTVQQQGGIVDIDAGNFCGQFCEVLEDADANKRYKPRSFYLL